MNSIIRNAIVLVCVLVTNVANSLGADDWPQFRGPGGIAISDESNVPIRWSGSENIRWKADLPGRGISSPIVADGRVYLTACSDYRQRRLHILCFDSTSGKKLWDRQVQATGSTTCNSKTCMAAATPASDGERVYALFASGDLACLDKNGDLLWYRSLVSDYPQISNQVGLAASPIVWNDLLFLPMENAGDSFAAALDKLTGQNRWKVGRTRGIYWVTPHIIKNQNTAEVLFQTDKDTTAYDPETGRTLWSYGANTPSPIVSAVTGEGMIYIPGQDFVALKAGSDGIPPSLVWKSNKLRPGYASALYYRGDVYALGNSGILTCAQAATGKIRWQERLKKGSYWASPLAADGHIYCVNEEGITSVLKCGEKPAIVSTNDVGDNIMATPAISGGMIYLRSDRSLIAVAKPPA